MGRFENERSRDPAINVVSWFLLVVSFLSVLVRLGTKLWMFHRLTRDDYLIVVSFVRINPDGLVSFAPYSC